MKRIASIFLLFATVCSFASGQSSVTNSVREYRTANEHQLLSDFVEMLSIPNVASDTANIYRNADNLVGLMKKNG